MLYSKVLDKMKTILLLALLCFCSFNYQMTAQDRPAASVKQPAAVEKPPDTGMKQHELSEDLDTDEILTYIAIAGGLLGLVLTIAKIRAAKKSE